LEHHEIQMDETRIAEGIGKESLSMKVG